MFGKTLLSLLLVAVVSAEVPSYIHVCGRKNPQLDQCILRSVEMMTDKLRSGIPELDVPPTEPVSLDSIEIADFDNFKASAKNVKLHGLSRYTVKYLHVDLDAMIIYLSINFQKVELSADYDINTRIVVQVAGKGPIQIISNGIDANVTLKYTLVEHKGKQYLHFNSVTTKLVINDFTAHFEDPTNSQNSLATAINAALDSTRQEVIERTQPNIEKTVSTLVLQVANKICQHFTYDELFPDRT